MHEKEIDRETEK